MWFSLMKKSWTVSTFIVTLMESGEDDVRCTIGVLSADTSGKEWRNFERFMINIEISLYIKTVYTNK